ncbi:hypothetical protein B9479_000023 [Cryptococcus floricola]|uniref:Uncharacterized protein n=1 Tax=Cryptococcus floricola TaxID=2591691 RepID=A0A5D3B886_9TREE|nr:hypothetical protein B9479_000023 [Cryptococcus floricola]
MTLTQQDPMPFFEQVSPLHPQTTPLTPLTKSPFVLSRCYLHLAEKPEENRTVLLAKIQEV